MAQRKTYEVTGSKNMLTRHMTFQVEVPHGSGVLVVPRSITIKGHLRPIRRRGRLVTSEAALIKAIDQRIKNAGRKTGLVLLREETIPDHLAEKSPEIVQTRSDQIRFIDEVDKHDVKKTIGPDDEITTDPVVVETPKVETPEQPKPIREVPGVIRVQDAKQWLLDNFKGLKTRDVSNKDLITRFAKDNNIKFVDLMA